MKIKQLTNVERSKIIEAIINEHRMGDIIAVDVVFNLVDELIQMIDCDDMNRYQKFVRFLFLANIKVMVMKIPINIKSFSSSSDKLIVINDSVIDDEKYDVLIPELQRFINHSFKEIQTN
jgi:hypothetical protein